VKISRDKEEFEKKIELISRPAGMMVEFDGGHIADMFEGGKSLLRSGFSRLYVHDGHVLPPECGGPVFSNDKKFVGLNIARFSRTQTYVLPAKEVFKTLRSTVAAASSKSTSGDQP
jgi:serine protease Do